LVAGDKKVAEADLGPVRYLATLLGALTYHIRRDDLDLVVFCFAKPEDAEAFCEEFGGERLPSDARR
jgi:hypothetical protein